MLLCGAAPPSGASACVAMAVTFAGGRRVGHSAGRTREHVCRRQTCCSRGWSAPSSRASARASALPTASPSRFLRSRQGRAARGHSPWPGCIGARPRRSGSAKVLLPSPPYVVAEEREERGVLCDREQLPVAQRPPFRGEVVREDADLRDNGSAMTPSARWREDPEEGDD
jgi:hypothetical protein